MLSAVSQKIILSGLLAFSLVTGTGCAPRNSDDTAARVFAQKQSDVVVQSQGKVIRLLSDDQDGSRHQRFILQLGSGQTLLISHNIDRAPRVEDLRIDDTVQFKGKYEWNEKGGVIHWTHHDPHFKHPGGWLIHNGRKYR
jgi:hypothetical protein